MLADYQAGFSIGTQWNYSINHFKNCFASQKENGVSTPIWKRIAHGLLGIIDMMPVVGLVSSLIERKIVHYHFGLTLRSRESHITQELERLTGLLQRLYVETQGGTTRREQGVKVKELNTSLNDAMALSLYHNIHNFLAHLPKEEQSKYREKFTPLLQKIDRSKDLFLIVGLIFQTSSHEKQVSMMNKMVQRVHQDLSQLAPGESYLLPGGYLNCDVYHMHPDRLGHAILCEVTKGEGGQFSFHIYNSGSGLSKHAELIISNRSIKYSNKVINNISKDKISVDFLKQLFSFFVPPLPEEKSLHSIGKVYAQLEKLGKLENDQRFHYCQGRIGSCAYQCAVRWMKGHIPKNYYYEFTRYTIENLLKKIQHRLSASRLPEDRKTRLTHPLKRMKHLPHNCLRDAIRGFFKGDQIEQLVDNHLLNQLMASAKSVKEKRAKKIEFLSSLNIPQRVNPDAATLLA